MAEQDRQGQQERSLVTRSTGETDMTAPQSRGILEAVHFSPQLPERLFRLNDAFAGLGPIVRSVSIRLIPGRVPRIDADPSYETGYVIGIEGMRSGSAALTIRSLEGLVPQWGLTMEQIQAFLAEISPDKVASLHAQPHEKVRETLAPLNMPISSITPEIVEELDREHVTENANGSISTHVLYERGSFEVHREGQRSPLFSLQLWHHWPNMDPKDKQIAFLVREISYEGSTSEVENAMEKITTHLFFPKTI